MTSPPRTKRPPEIDGAPTLEISGIAATIRLSRPSAHNRIYPDDIPVIRSQLDAVARRNDVRVLVLTGTGNATFSSGFTVDAIANRLDRSFEDLLDTVEQFPLPTLCALNGSVYGGATDLALCCDFRLGVHGSRMFMPAARFGLHYYPGGLRLYVTVLGVAQAKRLFLTAQTLEALEMLRVGFLTELVYKRALRTKVAEYVGALELCESAVVASMKQQLNAIATGIPGAMHERTKYEASLQSQELRKRLTALLARPK